MKLFYDKIEYVPSDKALEALCGLYSSHFRGRGIECDDLRQYLPGDDPKILAWTKFAETGQLYSKLFQEERDLSVYIAVDPNYSIAWRAGFKIETIIETVSLLAYSVIRSRDKLGVSSGSALDGNIHFIPAVRGKGIVRAEYIIRQVSAYLHRLRFMEIEARTLKDVLRPILRTGKHELLFVISDFMNMDQEALELLRKLSARADIVAIRVLDGWDLSPVSLGELPLESYDRTISFDSFGNRFHAGYAEELGALFFDIQKESKAAFDSLQLPLLELRESLRLRSDKKPFSYPYEVLSTFFRQHARQRRRR